MTVINTNGLSGSALDWAVLKCESVRLPNTEILKRTQIHTGSSCGIFISPKSTVSNGKWFKPSRDWAQGGLIIEREKMHISFADSLWSACTQQRDYLKTGSTFLTAAMRCYVTSVLGDAIDVPVELI